MSNFIKRIAIIILLGIPIAAYIFDFSRESINHARYTVNKLNSEANDLLSKLGKITLEKIKQETKTISVDDYNTTVTEYGLLKTYLNEIMNAVIFAKRDLISVSDNAAFLNINIEDIKQGVEKINTIATQAKKIFNPLDVKFKAFISKVENKEISFS